MRCEYCGRPIKPGDWQCPGCGAPVEGKKETYNKEQTTEDKYKQTTEKQYKQETYEEQKTEHSYYKDPNPYMQQAYDKQRQGFTTQEELFQRYGLSRNAYGGLIARGIAFMVDTIIVSIISCIPVVGIIGAILYVILGDSEKWDGQTIGKRVMGLKVVDLEYETISVGRSIWRNICKSISMGCFGFLILIFSGRNRTLHDFFAGTCVIKTR